MKKTQSESWDNFEHQIWKNLKESGLENQNSFVLCISGGLDSMVLLNVFKKLKAQGQLKVLHYHHGSSVDAELQKFRDSNVDLINQQVERSEHPKIAFITEKSSKVLNSEEQMRDARWEFIKRHATSGDCVVTAHHLDDRFETLLMKMLRGTGIEGFAAFKMWNNEIFRPFLNLSKTELLQYAQKHKIDWNQDPSNQDDSYLRNWLREKWLPELDQKVSGASKNLAKSLFKIADSLSETQTFELVMDPNSEEKALSRQWYVSLSKSEQLRALSLFLKKHQILSFTTGQLEEIVKRLDKNQKDITFEILGRKWVINASQIMLQ